jgi:hypothetical protein
MKFYLGTPSPNWLWELNVPLFVSQRRLIRQKTYKYAITEWALDSGGFSELSMYGEWRTSPEEYINCIKRYETEIGNLNWAAPQDWMCEPFIIEKTGLTVFEHQQRTIDSYIELNSADLNTPIIPILQGYKPEEYYEHIEMYQKRDITLDKLTGVGSVCRRQNTKEIIDLLKNLSKYINIHGFGVKTQGLKEVHQYLHSADSMSWSLAARRDKPLPNHTHKNCNSCPQYALQYYNKIQQILTS